jgi:hypothetical protein
MEYSIGQFLKLDDAYYIVTGLTESGRPNRLLRANKYGTIVNDQPLTNTSSEGWDIDWQEATPMDLKHAKYEKVFAKIKQLDRKFQNRDLTKKDLTQSNLADIITRLISEDELEIICDA